MLSWGGQRIRLRVTDSQLRRRWSGDVLRSVALDQEALDREIGEPSHHSTRIRNLISTTIPRNIATAPRNQHIVRFYIGSTDVTLEPVLSADMLCSCYPLTSVRDTLQRPTKLNISGRHQQ